MMIYLQSIALVCLAIVPTTFCYASFQDDQAFHSIEESILTDAKIDRDYEVVPINFSGRRHKRSDFLGPHEHMHLRAFGTEVDSWLHATDSVLIDENTPVYNASFMWEGQRKSVKFTLNKDLMKGIGRLYENETELDSVTIGKGIYGGLQVEGRLGTRGLVIRSLSEKATDAYVRKRRSTDGQADFPKLDYHIVYKYDNSHDAIMEPTRIIHKRAAKANSRIPKIIYPKILVVVDYSMYRVYENDINGLLKYLLPYWNSVDLKYRCLEAPRVRLHIPAIIFAVDPWGLSYIKKNNPDDRISLAPHATIAAAVNFFGGIKGTFPVNSYDVAVTMTRLFLGAGTFGKHNMGETIVGRACEASNKINSKEVYGIALLHDDGTFDRTRTAAHEIGHAFGLPDEVYDLNCEYKKGFVMAGYAQWTVNGSLFSECSLRKFDELLRNGSLTCLYNKPERFGKQLPKLLPGKMTSLTEMCIKLGKGSETCDAKEEGEVMDICVENWCRNRKGACVPSGFWAPEGTPCKIGDETEPGFCLRNKCVRLDTHTTSSSKFIRPSRWL